MIIGPQNRFPRYAVKLLCDVDCSVLTHFASPDRQSTIYENTILRDSSVNSGTYGSSTDSFLYDSKALIRYLPSSYWSSAVVDVEQGYTHCHKDTMNSGDFQGFRSRWRRQCRVHSDQDNSGKPMDRLLPVRILDSMMFIHQIITE